MTNGAWRSTSFHRHRRRSSEPLTMQLILISNSSPKKGSFTRRQEPYRKRTQFLISTQFLINEIIGMWPFHVPRIRFLESYGFPPELNAVRGSRLKLESVTRPGTRGQLDLSDDPALSPITNPGIPPSFPPSGMFPRTLLPPMSRHGGKTFYTVRFFALLHIPRTKFYREDRARNLATSTVKGRMATAAPKK